MPEPLIGPKDPTPPFGFSFGDRVIVEQKLEALSKRVDDLIANRRAEATAFYETRMLPLEQTVAKLQRLTWFAVGLAAASLTVQLVRIIALALTGRLPN